MKRTLVALGVVLALAVAAAGIAWNSIDLIVAWALEHYGPQVVGAPVDVGEVRISPRDGRGAVRGLEIGNPPGFSAGRAARFGLIRVQVDPGTLTERVIRVRELYIDAPSILYERGDRTTNLEAIQQHIAGYARGQTRESSRHAKFQDPGSVPGSRAQDPGSVPGSRAQDPGSAPGSKPGARRRFIIDRLVIKSARVTMTNTALRGQGLSFDLPDIEILDLGKRQGGLTGSEVANAVATTLQNRIARRVITNIDAIRRGGIEGAVDALRGLLK